MSQNPKSSDIPAFKEFLKKVALVPSPSSGDSLDFEIVHVVRDESNKIVYKLVSDHRLTAAEVRASLANAFKRTELWPDDATEIEIRV